MEEDERAVADQMRSKYSITDAEHKQILHKLGWSPVEYLQGFKLEGAPSTGKVGEAAAL